MADSEDDEWTGRVNPLVYAQQLLNLGEKCEYKTLAQWIENDGKRFHGVYVCPSTKVRDDSVNNRFLASTELLAAELGQIRPGVTLMVRVRGSKHKAPAADERYRSPGGACFLWSRSRRPRSRRPRRPRRARRSTPRSPLRKRRRPRRRLRPTSRTTSRRTPCWPWSTPGRE